MKSPLPFAPVFVFTASVHVFQVEPSHGSDGSAARPRYRPRMADDDASAAASAARRASS